MRIVISTDGNHLESQVSPVFARCPYFIIADVEKKEIKNHELLENSAMNQSSGAGTAAVQLIGDQDVDALIAGAVGPKTFSALNKWEIDIYRAEPGPVEKNVEKFLANELEEVESPTGPAGMGRGEDLKNE